MASTSTVVTLVNSVLGRVKLKLMRTGSSLERLIVTERRNRLILHRLGIEDESLPFEPRFQESMLPEGSQGYLSRDNPRLRELEKKYSSLRHPVMDHSRWSREFVDSNEVNLQYFRGDTYVWQYRNLNFEVHFLVTTNYIKSIDELGLLRTLEEDDLFGAYTFCFGGLTVSRDLLDSISEIYFLQRTLRISERVSLRILDIGAGYGRLAHRLVRACPRIERVFCVDPIAVSTFLSEYYLRFRGVDRQAIVVPFDDLDDALAGTRIDVAVNCHSFSECTLASIQSWLDILDRHGVRHLMIVPSTGLYGDRALLTTEKDDKHIDYLPALKSKGWELVVRQPKYLDPLVQRHGVSSTHYYLFERSV
jgi:SAM-dependent methyltransferase